MFLHAAISLMQPGHTREVPTISALPQALKWVGLTIIGIASLLTATMQAGAPLTCNVRGQQNLRFVEDICWSRMTINDTLGLYTSAEKPNMQNHQQLLSFILLFLGLLCMLPSVLLRKVESSLLPFLPLGLPAADEEQVRNSAARIHAYWVSNAGTIR